MSDGGRERAPLGVKVWKSSQTCTVQRSAVRSIAWLDLFGGIGLTLCIILKDSSGAPEQKSDNYDADEAARGRTSRKPCVKLQHNDQDDHNDDREATVAEDEKREHAGNRSDDDAECDRHCGNERRVLKPLLRHKLVADETACAGPVVDEVLYQRENSAEHVDGCVNNRSVARVLHALVGVIVE
jgi:hypothetical protein